jgi:NAD(P)-dependent dehydrogenase (short-subunit alcohol dehydrogenase family)
MKPVCLLTGGSGKLGVALVQKLSLTHSIVLSYNTREPDGFSQLKRRLDAVDDDKNDPFAVQANLRDRNDQRRLVEVTLARYGRVDILINCAADTKFHGALLNLAFSDRAEIDQLDLNCVQPMRLASLVHQECWKHDPEGNARMNRCVVNVSSISGLYVFSGVGQAFYAASKAALNHLTQFLANELKPYSVRVNAICPARFPDNISTSCVVDAITALIEGCENGRVVEVSRSVVSGRTISRNS